MAYQIRCLKVFQRLATSDVYVVNIHFSAVRSDTNDIVFIRGYDYIKSFFCGFAPLGVGMEFI